MYRSPADEDLAIEFDARFDAHHETWASTAADMRLEAE